MENRFTVPFKAKWMPFRRCEECGKRKLTSSLYQIHDNGLNSHIEAIVCLKCQKEAKKRAKMTCDNCNVELEHVQKQYYRCPECYLLYSLEPRKILKWWRKRRGNKE